MNEEHGTNFDFAEEEAISSEQARLLAEVFREAAHHLSPVLADQVIAAAGLVRRVSDRNEEVIVML
jgi:hypothetical protein